MMIGNPSRSTTVTEILYPMVRHCAIAALAMVCASASVMFFWVTIPCALAGNDRTAARAELARVLEIGDMSDLPTFKMSDMIILPGLRRSDRPSLRNDGARK